MDRTRSPIDVGNALFQQRKAIEEQGRQIKSLLGRVDSLERLVLTAWEQSAAGERLATESDEKQKGAKNGRR